MKYNIETVLVPEYTAVHRNYSPRGAFIYIKNNNGTVFYRCKDLKIEFKVQYIGGKLIECRTKYNRKIVAREDCPQEVEDFFDWLLNDAIDLWHI